MKTYTGLLYELPANGIFVFGSNTEGIHGAGAAYTAIKNFGAIYGQSQGRQGKSYAIMTKDLTKSKHPSITTQQIIDQIDILYLYAKSYPDLDFYIAYSSTGINLNGYNNEDMAKMFGPLSQIPENIVFEEGFTKLLTQSQ